MKFVVYSPWDGTQQAFTLKRKEIVEKFMENIMKGMSPNMSVMQMMWEGLSLSGMDFRVMGMEEMIQELQKQKRDLFSKYNLERAFDKPMNDLKFLLEQESMTRKGKGVSASPSYDKLPPGLMEKIKDLENFQFEDGDSEALFQAWRDRKQDILDLYEFYSRYAAKFKGAEALDFDQALELMRKMQSIDELQRRLLTGQISNIDPETLRQMLGDQAAQSFNILLQIPNMMTEQGVVGFDEQGFQMTPRGMRALAELAFGKVWQQIRKDRQGGYPGNALPTGEIEPDSVRPYAFGDRLDLDIPKTLFKAVIGGRVRGGQVQLTQDDFQVREREPLVASTTIVALDLSWSMAWEGRFEAAKKVALALDHYIRTRFPKDKLHIIGFSTEARELKGRDLSLAVWDRQRPFTNLQGGLRLAMELVKKSGNRNNRVIVITDGQPTAYYLGEHLHVELPTNMWGISPNACKATLAEVRKVTARGLNIETFMLDDNPALVEFTRQISRINRGRAIVCKPSELGTLIMVEEINRRGGRP